MNHTPTQESDHPSTPKPIIKFSDGFHTFEDLYNIISTILHTVEKQSTGMWFVKPANNAKYNQALDSAKEALAKAGVKP